MNTRLPVSIVVALAACISAASGPAGAAARWDQAKNVKEAAERLGGLHKKGGANGVLKFLDACYRTHTLASAYSAAIEGCVAQDVMYARVLSAVYARVPFKARVERSLPTAEQIGAAMQQRVSAVFRQYEISAGEAETLQKTIDRHGMPVILKASFPNAAVDAGQAK